MAACCRFQSPKYGYPLTHAATLKNVLDTHLDRPTAVVTAEVIHMFCIKQQGTVTRSSRNARVDKEMANATTCIYMKVLSVIYACSTLYLNFKIWSLPTTVLANARVNEPLRPHAALTYIIYLIVAASRPCPNVYQPSALQCIDRSFGEGRSWLDN